MHSTNDHLLRSTVKLVSGHEFRTPINAIYGLANIMYDDAGHISLKDQKEFSLHILRSAERLMNVSERISRWFELKNDVKKDKKSCCLTSDFLFETIKDDAEQYLTDGEGFMYISKVAELRLKGSKQIIVPALKELFNNAFKFSADNTLPSVLIFEQRGNYHIQINNFSTQISSADLKMYTVFTQFNRDKYEQQGLGLGIEIASLGIKKCGGTLNIIEHQDTDNLQKITLEIILPVND